MKFANHVFIVTGATSGMGKGIALEFATRGACLILSGRNADRGQQLERAIEDLPGEAVLATGDVGEIAYNNQLVELAVQTWGRLDGVLTNAGVLGLGALDELPPKTWNRTFRTNVDAVYYLLRAALPEMKTRGKGVVVINASIAAFKSFPNHPAYCASKAALVALTRQLAVDYGPEIRINSISPGPVDTPFLHDSARAFPVPEEAVSDAEDATLLKRLGTPGDIAKLVSFLASDDSSWITGSNFTIDGGILAGS